MKVRGQEVLDPRARIMSHVQRDPASGCWNWTGAMKGAEKLKRYGHLTVGSRRSGRRNVAAHRYAWEVFVGPIPAGQWVLHRCDNPSCVNPKHLFLGDREANVADRDSKGRNVQPRGEHNGMARLTDAQVAEIRAAYVPRKVTARMLAERYGAPVATVKALLMGRYRPAAPGEQRPEEGRE